MIPQLSPDYLVITSQEPSSRKGRQRYPSSSYATIFFAANGEYGVNLQDGLDDQLNGLEGKNDLLFGDRTKNRYVFLVRQI
jgi:hypothetical protein